MKSSRIHVIADDALHPVAEARIGQRMRHDAARR
jgi:hypothetical protein